MSFNMIKQIKQLLVLLIILLCYCLLLLHTCCLVISVGAVDEGFLLSKNSYSIRSSVTKVLREISSKQQVAQLEESYSISQRRAKLHYKVDYFQFDSDFYYDQVQQFGVFLSRNRKACKTMTPSEFYDNTFLSSIQMLKLFKLAGADQDNGYIIGPSKLLFLINQQADKLIKQKPETYDVPNIVRAHEVVEYKLIVKLSSDGIKVNDEQVKEETAMLSIFYDKATINQGYKPGFTIPLLLRIEFPQSSAIIYAVQVDFFTFELLPDDASQRVIPNRDTTSNQLEDNNLVKYLDTFTFPISYECSDLAPDFHKADLFEAFDLATVRFSFLAKTMPRFGPAHEHFVAFDGITQTFRIDSKRETKYTDSMYAESKQVLDFKINRKYTIVERPVSTDAELLLKTSSSSILELAERQRFCSVSRVFRPDKTNERDSLTLSKLLLGASKFMLMGRALVNGIDARVYEGQTNSMPYWFGQPTVYKYMNTTGFRIKENGRRVSEKQEDDEGENLNANNSKSLYSVVVYLSAVDADTGSFNVLLIEVYDMVLARTVSYRVELETRVLGFVWDLQEAPDGTSVQEMFSVRDACAVGQGWDRYAEVDLLLEEEPLQQEQGDAEVYDQTDDWSWDWVRRNQALASAITDVTDVQTCMMYDLESYMYEDTVNVDSKGRRRRALMASFRVAEHPSDLFELTFIGNAKISTNKTPDQLTSISVPSLDECLWLAHQSYKNGLSERASVFIYYSEMGNTCILDSEGSTKAVESANNIKVESDLLVFNARYSGEVYRVDLKPDRVISLSNSWLRDSKFKRLEEREIIMQAVKAGNIVEPLSKFQLRMRIKRAKINNVNYMSKLTGEGADETMVQQPASVFPGFGLIEQQEIATSRQQQQQATGTSSSDTPLSLNQCQALCLSDLECKSYSYCVRGTQTECVTSTVGFISAGVREQLESRDTQAMRSKSMLTLVVGGTSVELLRDFRCSLYNKLYMQLFERRLSSRVTTKMLQLSQVDRGQEECAEKCFAKSLSALKEAAELDEQVKQMHRIETQLDESNLKQIQTLIGERKRVMGKFCDFFFYFDSTLTKEQQKLVDSIIEARDKQQAAASTTTTGSNRICALEDGSANNWIDHDTDNKNDKFGMSNTHFLFDTYKFDYSTLYERQFGLSLRESELSTEEMNAYLELSLNDDDEQQVETKKTNFELVERALEANTNFQYTTNGDESACAEKCFSQSSSLWPACRSFDVVRVRLEWDKHAQGLEHICRLNTQVLAHARSQDIELLVAHDTQNKVSKSGWHFELRFNSILGEQIESAYGLEQTLAALNALASTRLSSLVGGFVMTLVVLCAFASGAFFGLKLAQRVKRHPFMLNSSSSSTNIDDNEMIVGPENMQHLH